MRKEVRRVVVLTRLVMLDITRNGIYNNLNISSYSVTLENITYYFSSRQYLNKFINIYKNNRLELKAQVEKKLEIELEANQIYDLILYQKIEKRGFRVVYGGKELCPNTIEYAGQIKIPKNLEER